MILINNDEGDCYVKFRYDEAVLNIIRSLAWRKWDSANKVWWIDPEDARSLATRLHRLGFSVFIDNKEFVPPAIPKPPDNKLIVGLFQFLPTELRKPTYLALSKVWHPDMGGDTVLMQQLNEAIEKTNTG